MREILFKGKSKRDGQWVVGSYVNVGNGVHQIWVAFSKQEREMHKGMAIEGDYGYWEEIIPETLCEYTGLHDKNGKRIWENDIVKTKFGRPCKMVWRQTQCFVGWDFVVCNFDLGVNDFSKPPSSWDLYLPENLEVVGNSIDNPELLTAERNE